MDQPVNDPITASPMNLVILGLSITSSWGNGHATTYRGLVRALAERGHRVLFLERDVPWYACHRDLPNPPYGRTCLYGSLDELKSSFGEEVRNADAVIIGSYVPEGVAAAEWTLATAKGIRAFYDLDTPVTLASLEAGKFEYLTPELISRFDLYLSFTGGPVLRRLESELKARRARVLYCSADPRMYYPEEIEPSWDFGYLGTYSPDRQPTLESLMLDPARAWDQGRMIVAGPLYPPEIAWPSNVSRIDHLPPCEHRRFYNQQRFTFNATRANMVCAGYSPSVRLFEAAASGTPVISDTWPGIGEFFEEGSEILISRSSDETLSYLRDLPEASRLSIAARARSKVLNHHTGMHRAKELESYLNECS